ncbi:hypothetical protein EAI_16681 [Harpegnathos saltator]|uniref:Uncharacterized protein n=1 Tax=Harpegnathos saltator TaxID=610380 RepID=E2BER2_HARSA|nr:hypothetical protein EAI_16681 [Harpegnathos saltator]
MAHENGINGGDTDSETVELNPLRRTRFHVNRVDSLEGRASLLGEQETKKSLRHMTREALPRLDNYRNIMSIQAAHRPSLDELHNPTLLNKLREQIVPAALFLPDWEIPSLVSVIESMKPITKLI